MRITEQHSSPDGLLTLVVGVDDSGDVSIGFKGYAWHTHGDILASLAGLPMEQAVRLFVEDVVSGRSMIAVSRVSGVIRDIWLTDDHAKDMRYKPEEEIIEFRRWDGSPFIVEPDAAPNSRPPSGLRESSESETPDSLRTSSSGGCG